ncbi:TIGR03618 family F420-dependent PPOX class oxidoreductase [Blastococcus sp. SYSU DS0510]
MSTEPVLRDLTPAETTAFLDSGTLTAVVATLRPDGRPHAAPVGFVTDGDDLLFLTGTGTVKAGNLRRDARVAVVVAENGPPYRFVLVEGAAQFVDEPRLRDDVARRTWRRYVGAQPADDAAAPPGDVLVRVRPDRLIARTHG